jgi:hypothetical protein
MTKAKFNPNLEIPFNEILMIGTYGYHRTNYNAKCEVKNHKFFAELKIINYIKNNSSYGLEVEDINTKVRYYMTFHELQNVIKYSSIELNIFKGNFYFKKQGSAYSLVFDYDE